MTLIDEKELVRSLQGKGRLLIGVSGGADSMALLHIILQNRGKLSNEIKVLHVNHQINRESKTWAQLVHDYCTSNQIPVQVVNVDVSVWDNNEEKAARLARYDAFSKQEFDTLLLAHHANDQIETFFLKLFRGSGVKGLRCMAMQSPCWFDQTKLVMRPLLKVKRQQIEEYVEQYQVPYVTDPSNVDRRFDRNWIRHDLVPLIEQRNSKAYDNILHSVEIQTETYELIFELAEIDRQACSTSDGNLDWLKVKSLGLVRIKNLIMHLCAANLVDASTRHIEDFAKGLIETDMDGRNEMRLRGFSIRKVGKTLIIGR